MPVLLSWNIWCIPFAGPKCLSRWRQCIVFVVEQLCCLQPAEDELVILCFQEAWAWRCGFLMWPILFLISVLESRCCSRVLEPTSILPDDGGAVSCKGICAGNSFFSLIAQVLCVLTFWCAPFIYWDPKHAMQDLIQRACEQHSVFSPARHSVGASSPCRSSFGCGLLDSGLLLLSSHRPIHSGFEAYKDAGGEVMANKGLLWAYWETHDIVVITTHLSAGGEGSQTTANQVQQLLHLTTSLTTYRQTDNFRLFVAGDMNIPLGHSLLEDLRRGGLLRSTGDSPTTCHGEAGGRIDHIFQLQSDDNFFPLECGPVHTPLSDHALQGITWS